jgi:uncharacterized protein YjiK
VPSHRDAASAPPDAGSPPSLDASIEQKDAGTPRDAAPERIADAAPPEVGEAQTHALEDYELEGSPRVLSGVSDNLSDVAWRPETDTFFVVENGVARLHEYTSNFGSKLRSIALLGASSDTEGLAYLGDGRFAVVVEENDAYVFPLPDGAVSVDLADSSTQRYAVASAPAVGNRGFEGVGYDSDLERFFVCQEGLDGEVPMRVLSFDDRQDGSFFSFESDLDVTEAFEAQDVLSPTLLDLSGLHYDRAARNLLLLSDESGLLVRADADSGEILEQREFSTSRQYEGVTLADRDRLILVSEPNVVEIYRAARR